MKPAARKRGPSPQARALEFIRALPDHRLIDRLVRGRSWIPLLGVMLAGIVATQVELLKLNASIGRSIDLSSALQSRNELLRASISSLSDPQRIEHLATGLGMVMPGPTSIFFLDAGRGSAANAAASIHAPDAAAFESSLAASAAAAQAQSTGTATSATSTGDSPSGATATSAAPLTSDATSSAPSTVGDSASAPATSNSASVGPTQTVAPATSSLQSPTSTQSPGTASAPGLSTGSASVAPAASVGATASGGQSATGSP